MQNDNTNALELKKNLIDELKAIYSLIDVSNVFLKHEASTELESLIDVTAMARDMLYHTYKALEKEIKE